MKKFTSLALSLALTASLVAPAFAAETDIMPISAPLTYGYEITVNGVKLDTTKLPAADENYIPMRVVAESDHGSASWYQEDNTGSFYMGDLYVTVSFSDNSITMGEKKLDKAAIVKDGVTYVPVSVFDGLKGYTVANKDGKIDIVTPNNAPLVKLGYSVIDATDAACRMKSDAKDFLTNFELDYDKNFESGIIFTGMNLNADTLFVGKLKKGADLDAVKAALEAYRKAQEDTFSWYQPQNLPMVQAAKTTVNGDYVMFLMADEADKGIELFNTWAAEQK